MQDQKALNEQILQEEEDKKHLPVTAPATKPLTNSVAPVAKRLDVQTTSENHPSRLRNFGWGFVASATIIELCIAALYMAQAGRDKNTIADSVYNGVTNLMWSMFGLDGKPNEGATAGMMILSSTLISIVGGAAAAVFGGKPKNNAKV